MKQPLSELELALFQRCLWDAVSEEFSPREERALMTGNPNFPGD